jgi:hypothetical protein
LVESAFFIPYWAGFYGQEHSVRVLMLDAIRGTIEGGKITSSVKAWLLEGQFIGSAGAQASNGVRGKLPW